MFTTHTKRWGNSIGIVIPKQVAEQHNIKLHENIVLEIKEKRSTVLHELFGAIQFSKPVNKLVKEARKELESKL